MLSDTRKERLLHSREKIDAWILYFEDIILGILIGTLIFIYIFYAMKQALSIWDDHGYLILLGREMLAQKSLIPINWFPTTGVATLGSPIFIAFLNIFFDDLMFCSFVAVLLDNVLLAGSFLYLLKSLDFKYREICFAFLFLAGIRSGWAAGTWGLGWSFYGMMLSFIFLTWGCYCNLGKGNRRHTERLLLLVLPIAAFLWGIESVRTTMYLYVPLLVTLMLPYLRFWNASKVPFEGWWKHCCLLLVANIAGIMTTKLYLSNTLLYLPFTVTMARELGEIPAALSALAREFIGMDFPFWQARQRLYSVPSLITAFTILLYCGVGYFCLLRMKKIQGNTGSFIRFIVLGLIIVFIGTVYGRPTHAAYRYMLMFYVLQAVVMAQILRMAWRGNRLVYHALVFAAVTYAGMSLYSHHYDYIQKNWTGGKFKHPITRHVSEIEATFSKYGVKHGYGTYNNTHTTTVMTNGRITVAPVKMWDWLRPQPSGGTDANYAPELADKKAFLIFTAAEVEKNKQYPRNKRFIDMATHEEIISDESGKIHLFLFEKNPFILAREPKLGETFKYLPARDMRYSNFIDLNTDDFSMRSDSESGKNCHIFGPYMRVGKGEYRIEVKYSVEDSLGDGQPVGSFVMKGRVGGKGNIVDISERVPLPANARSVVIERVVCEKIIWGTELEVQISPSRKVVVSAIEMTRTK